MGLVVRGEEHAEVDVRVPGGLRLLGQDHAAVVEDGLLLVDGPVGRLEALRRDGRGRTQQLGDAVEEVRGEALPLQERAQVEPVPQQVVEGREQLVLEHCHSLVLSRVTRRR